MIADFAQDGTPLARLRTSSKKKILRTCDRCGREDTVEYRSVYGSRHKRGKDQDYCRKCTNLIANANRKAPRPYSSNGYLYIQKGGKQVPVHKLLVEENIGRELEPYEVVHHVDGNKKNNRLENLFLCRNQKEHVALHDELEKIACTLLKRGVIGFDHDTRGYFLREEEATLPISLGFESIAIRQKKSRLVSRLDADISSEVIRGLRRPVPLLASNMSTVVNARFCVQLWDLGSLGVLHRAAADEELVAETRYIADHCPEVAVSVGFGASQRELCRKLVDAGATIVNVDIAHGYSEDLIDFARDLKSEFGVRIIVGNTTNGNMLRECNDFADALKVGIAQGFACETKNTAGCTERQFSAVLKFRELSKKYGLPIISDGGTREPADLTKAIGAGASSVMAGSIFAACPESAAQVELVDDVPKKVYAGMASEYVQAQWRGGLKPGTCAEGGVRYLDLGLPAADLLERYSGALRSGISYAGGVDILSFQESVEFVRFL